MDLNNYIHWEDYYKTKWLDNYNAIVQCKNNNDHENPKMLTNVLNIFTSFFLSSCELLRYYIENNGLFYSNYKRILMSAFRCGLIDDGDSWVTIYDLISKIDTDDIENMTKIVNYSLNQHFDIFNDLYYHFNKLMEDYDTNSNIIL